MVNVGDKVRVQLSEESVADFSKWLSDPSGLVGRVAFTDGDDEFPIAVEFEKEDDEDNRVFPDFFTEQELEVVLDD